MIKYLQSLALSKPFMLVLMGVSVGFSLNMLLSSVLNNHCSSFSDYNGMGGHKSEYSEEHYELHYISKSGVAEETVPKDDVKNQRVVRPRFLSSELGLKDKMVISVLTSKDTLETYGSAINKTMQIPIAKSKLLFFMNGFVKESSNKAQLVMFSDVDEHVTPFLMLKYLSENYLKTHNWFYIFPDTTFVNRQKLEKFVDHISVGEDVIIGSNSRSGSKMCDFNAGILLSQALLSSISANLHWCVKTLRHDNHSLNVDRCLRYALAISNQTCTSQINKLMYQSINLNEMADSSFSLDAISFSHVKSESQIYNLYRKIAEETKARLEIELSKLITYNEYILPFMPNENHSMPWPFGSKMNTRAKNRFDVLRWHYFNGSHIFHDRYEENLKPLKGVDKLDVSDILREAMNHINKDEKSTFVLEKLLNGYRRFDAARGMEYILDVLLSQTEPSPIRDRKVMKRIHLVKPLGFPEVVPIPYVNENSKVYLILMVRPDERNHSLSFIDSFTHTCIESGDNSHLLIVFIYETPTQQSDDIFNSVKSTVSFYENKYQSKARISWISILSNHTDKFVLDAMDVVQRRLSKNSLVLICATGMELKIDFLNHVRMNTILGIQVYFPIGYSSYEPRLVYGKHSNPSPILINQKSGHYSASQYDFASFYLADFIYAKSQMFSIGADRSFINLYELFVRYHSINVFRAIDPALRVQYKDIKCQEFQEGCSRLRYRSLASRSQLAMLLFEHIEGISERDDIHRRKEENSWEVKPDI